MDPTPQQLGKYTVHVRTLLTDVVRPTLLLIHGLGVSGEYYVPYAEALKDSFNVYILDLPGYGKTPKPHQPLTISELAGLVTLFVKQNNLESVSIVGQSMGCQVVAHALTEAPELFCKAILIGPTSNKDERTLALHSWRLTQDTFREPIGANIVVFRNYMRMGPRRYVKTALFMLRDHIEDRLPGSRTPILFVRGANDPIVPTEWLSLLQTITPHASMVEIADAAHLVQYEKAATLAAITKEFILV